MATEARRLSEPHSTIIFTVIVAIAGLIAACSGHDKDLTDPSNVVEISVSPSSAQYLQIGQAQQMTATPLDIGGDAVAGETIAWNSSDSTIASVSPSGLVNARAAGTASITASCACAGRSTSVAMIVQAPVASISITTSSIALAPGGTAQVQASAEDASGNALVGEAMTWNSSNAAVATVSTTGIVTAIAIGAATITATSEGVSGTATVTVSATTAPIAALAITPDSVGIGTGSAFVASGSDHQLQLRAIATDSAGNIVNGQTVAWSSSNAAVATVSTSGLITGSPDVTTSSAIMITATSAGKVAVALFWVNPPVTSVVISPPTATLSVGGTIQLTASIQDANGHSLNGVPLTWGSGNAKVARQSKGLVSAISTGSAAINALTPGGIEGTATITVTSGVSEIRTAGGTRPRGITTKPN
jgi:uncharacterized protein YjdB